MALGKAFGYNKKEELLGKNVAVLMPTFYGKYHKKFIENALTKPAELI